MLVGGSRGTLSSRDVVLFISAVNKVFLKETFAHHGGQSRAFNVLTLALTLRREVRLSVNARGNQRLQKQLQLKIAATVNPTKFFLLGLKCAS